MEELGDAKGVLAGPEAGEEVINEADAAGRTSPAGREQGVPVPNVGYAPEQYPQVRGADAATALRWPPPSCRLCA